MDQPQTTNVGLPLILLVVGIVGMLLLAVGIIVFFVLYQKRLLAQREQMRQQELVYQKELLQTAVAAEEAERKRIAHDLHDGVGSSLSTTKLFLNQLRQNIPATDYQAIKTETSDLLNETITNVRNIVRNLAPPSLEQFGLVAAVQEMCHRIQDFGVLQIHFDYNRNQRLEPAKEVALYRALQELINNTIKHAQASAVHVSMFFSPKELELRYEDNGKGFDQTQPPTKGLGLKSIESRISTIKGKINYQSAKNQGVCVKIIIEIT